MSGCLKWGLIGGGVFIALAVLGVGCIAVVGESVSDSIDEAIGEADPDDYDIELTDCSGPDEFGSAEASGRITNTSDKAQGFQIDVRFEDANGDLIEISPTFLDRLDIDQSTNWDITTFEADKGSGDITCEIDEVSYTIFDDE